MSKGHTIIHLTIMAVSIGALGISAGLLASLKINSASSCSHNSLDSHGELSEPSGLKAEFDIISSDEILDFRVHLKYTLGDMPIESIAVTWEIVDSNGEVKHFIKKIPFYDKMLPGTYVEHDAIVVHRFYDRNIFPDPCQIEYQAKIVDIQGNIAMAEGEAGHMNPAKLNDSCRLKKNYYDNHPYFRKHPISSVTYENKE